MRHLYLLFLAIFLWSCGSDQGPRGRTGPGGADCYDASGDVNGDGELTADDCVGATGPAGADGKDGTNGVDGQNGADGTNGIDGKDGKDGEDGQDFVPPVSLEGYYTFSNGGYLELIENSDGKIVVYGTQRLYSVNFDTGLALHPSLPGGPHTPHDGIVSGEYSPNYNSTTNDVEVDGQPSTNISGKRKTFYKLWLTNSGRLKVQLIVYSSSGLAIEVNRTLTSN